MSRPGAALAALLALALVLTAAAPAAQAPPLASEQIGTSVQGRPIALTRVGAPAARKVLVVGCVHGDECAGRAIVEQLAATDPATLAGSQLLLVRTLNPDGLVRGTRQNARGVDLNRNGSVGRRDLGPRGTRNYAGPRAFSEPETRAIRAVILRERPSVIIWYHQPLGGVDVPEAGWHGRARRYAKLVGLELRPLPAYPGSLSRWANERVTAGSSFVVELPAGPLRVATARRHADAVLALAGVSPEPRSGASGRAPVPRSQA